MSHVLCLVAAIRTRSSWSKAASTFLRWARSVCMSLFRSSYSFTLRFCSVGDVLTVVLSALFRRLCICFCRPSPPRAAVSERCASGLARLHF